MNCELVLLIAYTKGLARERALVDWAAGRLVEGSDSQSIKLLAGLLPAEYTEARTLFVSALSELGHDLRKDTSLILFCATLLARDIAESTISPDAGLDELVGLWEISCGTDSDALYQWRQLAGNIENPQWLHYHGPRHEAIRTAGRRFLDSYTDL